MRATTRTDVTLAVVCLGVMVFGVVWVGEVPFRRVGAAARYLSLDPEMSGCVPPSRRDSLRGPDVYVVPVMGFDVMRTRDVILYLEDALGLSVALAPPMHTCVGCVVTGEVDLDRMYDQVHGHLPELNHHSKTIRLALTEVDISSGNPIAGSMFGGRTARVPVAVVSSARLGEGDRVQSRLNKLSARYVARMSLQCHNSNDPRSVVHIGEPGTLDDVDVMQSPAK